MITERLNIEAVVLNGGASRRMGRDKAAIPVHGMPMAERTVLELLNRGLSVTVLGRPVPGAPCIEDAEPFAGPLNTLARFEPAAAAVFVCSCDLPELDVRTVDVLASRIGTRDAAVPVIDGRAQPLCALYAARSLEQVNRVLSTGKRSVMAWLDILSWVAVMEKDLTDEGVRPASVLGVNTLSDLRERGIDIS